MFTCSPVCSTLPAVMGRFLLMAPGSLFVFWLCNIPAVVIHNELWFMPCRLGNVLWLVTIMLGNNNSTDGNNIITYQNVVRLIIRHVWVEQASKTFINWSCGCSLRNSFQFGFWMNWSEGYLPYSTQYTYHTHLYHLLNCKPNTKLHCRYSNKLI